MKAEPPSSFSTVNESEVLNSSASYGRKDQAPFHCALPLWKNRVARYCRVPLLKSHLHYLELEKATMNFPRTDPASIGEIADQEVVLGFHEMQNQFSTDCLDVFCVAFGAGYILKILIQLNLMGFQWGF